MKRWTSDVLFPLVGALLLAGVAVCTPSEERAAGRTARDVCALIAPDTDGGTLFEKLVHDVAELEQLERARLDAAAARARDGGAP